MILSYSNILHFLIGIVPSKSIFNNSANTIDFQILFADFIIEDTSIEDTSKSRNRIFIVSSSKIVKQFILIKQPIKFNKNNLLSIRREALFYKGVCNCFVDPLEQFKPKLYHFDEKRNIIIRQYNANLKSVYKQFKNECTIPFAKIFVDIGQCLKTFHSNLKKELIETEYEEIFMLNFPSPFLGYEEIKENLYIWTNDVDYLPIMYFYNKQTTDDLKNKISEIRNDWKFDFIIHSDLKLDNILSKEGSNSNRQIEPSTWIIDWEMAMFGEPAWDVAFVLYELFYLLFLPLENGSSQMKIKSYFIEFYRGYISHAILEDTERLKIKILNYCGIKFLENIIDEKNSNSEFNKERKEWFYSFAQGFLLQPSIYLKFYFDDTF